MKNSFSILIAIMYGGLSAQNPLLIPDTLSGPNYNLTLHRDSVQFFPSGKISYTYGFNANKYLGPTLILNKANSVNITVNNQLGDTTTIHWHGLHVPSKWDGGPHTPILPSSSWNPQFTVMDNAATYWYHPHLHMKTAEQAIKGAAGMIIVRDNAESALLLPRKYGVDDFPLIVQCQQYDSLNQAMPLGMQDSTLLVNGTIDPFLNLPAQVVRLRLLNAAGERVFNFGFTGSLQFYHIATDGGLLDAPYLTSRVRLSPGERAEVLLDLSGMNGQSFYLVCFGSELPMGVQGGPTMPMPGGPPMNSPLNGVNYNILKINVAPVSANPVTTIPSTLTVNTPWLPSQASVTRTIRFTADSSMVMDGPFYFNDSTFNMDRIDYRVPLNSIEIWKLVNKTMVAHPFHIHDVQFYVLDRNGIPPGPEERGRKDVILVPPGDSIRFITKFEDFVDTIIPYMYHCHILMHEDDGMMGQFLVVPDAVGIKEYTAKQPGILSLFPNPANGRIQICINGFNPVEPARIKIFNSHGKLISEENVSKPDLILNSENWTRGIYLISIVQGENVWKEKVILAN